MVIHVFLPFAKTFLGVANIACIITYIMMLLRLNHLHYLNTSILIVPASYHHFIYPIFHVFVDFLVFMHTLVFWMLTCRIQTCLTKPCLALVALYWVFQHFLTNITANFIRYRFYEQMFIVAHLFYDNWIILFINSISCIIYIHLLRNLFSPL